MARYPIVSPPDVVVVGGGVIGLACAWRAAARGLRVTVIDDRPGRGATWAAAGMLAPVTEAHYGEEALVRLNVASAGRWPAFAQELEGDSGSRVGYRACGTLAVAVDAGDRDVLVELHRFQRSLGLDCEVLSSRECRALEPLLTPSIRGGLLAGGDHQVDNRSLVDALLGAVDHRGVEVRRSRVAEILVGNGRAVGVGLVGGDHLGAGSVLLAAGCWSGQLAGLPAELASAVRPVKGHILRLRGPARPALLSSNVRGLVKGKPLYLVPRADGTIVVGATVEEQGFDTTVRAGPVRDLLGDAVDLVPALGELQLAETAAGLRPGSADNAPIIGRTSLPGLSVAAGHFRNGILLAPLTAEAMAAVLAGESEPTLVAPFSPRRLVGVEAGA